MVDDLCFQPSRFMNLFSTFIVDNICCFQSLQLMNLFLTFMVDNLCCFQSSWLMNLFSIFMVGILLVPIFMIDESFFWIFFVSNLHGWWSLFPTLGVDDPYFQLSWLVSLNLLPTIMVDDLCFHPSWLIIFFQTSMVDLISNLCVVDLF